MAQCRGKLWLNQPYISDCAFANTGKNLEYHQIPQNGCPHDQKYDCCSMSHVRCNDYLINYSQCFCNYPAHTAGGTNESPTVCPKAGVLIFSQQQCDSKDTRLRLHLVLHQGWELMLSHWIPARLLLQYAVSPDKREGERRERSGSKEVYIHGGGPLSYVIHITHTTSLPFVNKTVMQPV